MKHGEEHDIRAITPTGKLQAIEQSGEFPNHRVYYRRRPNDVETPALTGRTHYLVAGRIDELRRTNAPTPKVGDTASARDNYGEGCFLWVHKQTGWSQVSTWNPKAHETCVDRAIAVVLARPSTYPQT